MFLDTMGAKRDQLPHLQAEKIAKKSFLNDFMQKKKIPDMVDYEVFREKRDDKKNLVPILWIIKILLWKVEILQKSIDRKIPYCR